ncbi:MAG: hypothetical protein AB7T49_00330 [Oligoflexales bacterium]
MRTGEIDLQVARTIGHVMRILEDLLGNQSNWSSIRSAVLKCINEIRNTVVERPPDGTIDLVTNMGFLMEALEAMAGEHPRWEFIRHVVLKRVNGLAKAINEIECRDNNGKERKGHTDGTKRGRNQAAYQGGQGLPIVETREPAHPGKWDFTRNP